MDRRVNIAKWLLVSVLEMSLKLFLEEEHLDIFGAPGFAYVTLY